MDEGAAHEENEDDHTRRQWTENPEAETNSSDTAVVTEPEAEDEADGWEIVTFKDSGRPRTSSREYNANEKAGFTPDELPEDLIMGCLDPECDAQFGEGGERHRCGCCRLLFCERHLVRCPLISGRVRSPSTISDRCSGACNANGNYMARARSPRARACSGDSVSLVDAALGMIAVASPGAVMLCNECRVTWTAPKVATRLTLGPGLVDSDSTEEVSIAAAQQVQPSGEVDGIDAVAVAMEVQTLQILSVSELKEIALSADQPANKVIAQRLLLQLLSRLRTCLRPWADAERDWIWRLKDELVEAESGWLPQLVRQVSWESYEEAKGISKLIEHMHDRRKLSARDAVQVLSSLGRRAIVATETLGERNVGLLATRAAQAVATSPEGELTYCLELLLDAAEALGTAGATGGRRAIVGMLVQAACGGSGGDPALEPVATLRGELFWALEARSAGGSRIIADGGGGMPNPDLRTAWASNALEELLRGLPTHMELGLLRQRAWVRRLERGEFDAARKEPGPWGESRAFPLAVWPPSRLCLGMDGQPKNTQSKCAPVIVRCSCRDQASDPCEMSSSHLRTFTSSASSAPAPAVGLGVGTTPPSTSSPASATSQAGLLLKRDAGMHREQQVGQTLRLLEQLIWEDDTIVNLLARAGLKPEDLRATYAIAMTGPGTAIVEYVESAVTLKEVRAGGLPHRIRAVGRDTLLEFLKKRNEGPNLARALCRLACTSAISAVLSFVAGLGDRHHENFMVTSDGRLLHVDYGYALGREPVDSVLIHYMVQGRGPVATLQYEELYEALGPDLVRRVFWPVARAAYLRVRLHAGLLAEMVHAAVVRDVREQYDAEAVSRAWTTAQAFVVRRCATAVSDPCAERFIHALLWHCARHERGTKLRDELKGRLREWPQQAVNKAYNVASVAGRTASAAVGIAADAVGGVSGAVSGSGNVPSNRFRGSPLDGARGAAADLLCGVRELLRESSAGVPLPKARNW